MPTIDVDIKKIEVKRNDIKEFKQKLDITTSPAIIDIEKTDLKMGDIKDILKVKFKFESVYNPDVGHLYMEGEVIYAPKDSKKVLDDWKKNKKVEKEIAADIFNPIFERCLKAALLVTNEVRLRSPLQFPKLNLEDENKYIN